MNILQPHFWIEKYAKEMLSFAIKKLGNKEIAEDLLQDTFLSAFKNKETFKGNSSEKTWLYQILKNKIIDYYRSKIKSITDSQISLSDWSTEEHFQSGTQSGRWLQPISPTMSQSDIESKFDSKELRFALQNCISKLPTKMNLVFMARYIEDNEAEKICKEMNITPSNYWTIIHRAKIQIKECLDKKGLIQ